MKTKEQLEKEFREDFQKLLNKYNAEVDVDDHWQGYAECGRDIKVMVSSDAIYDNDYNCVQEAMDFDLGTVHFSDQMQARIDAFKKERMTGGQH